MQAPSKNVPLTGKKIHPNNSPFGQRRFPEKGLFVLHFIYIFSQYTLMFSRASNRPVNFRSFLSALLFFAIYYLLSRGSQLFATFSANISPVWLPSGLSMAFLFFRGRRLWPVILIGSLAADLITSKPFPWPAALTIAIGNAAEALVASTLVKWLQWKKNRFLFHGETLIVTLSGAAGAFFSATIGMSGLLLSGLTSSSEFAEGWMTWWSGNVLGCCVLSPLLWEQAATSRQLWNWRLNFSFRSNAFWLLPFLAVCVLFYWTRDPIIIFSLYPLILTVAIRTDRKRVLIVNLLLTLILIGLTLSGQGPFGSSLPALNLVGLQLAIFSLTITSLFLANLAGKTSFKRLSKALLVGWSLSALLFFALQQWRKSADHHHFESLVAEATNDVENHMALYETALYGGRGLYGASKSVEREEWGSFIDAMDLFTRSPGIRGLGMVLPISKPDLPGFLNDIKQNGIPDFDLKTVPNGDGVKHEHYIITFIEPFEPNKAALGLDLASEKERREAAELARDTGRFTLTGRIVLVQDNKKGPGFLVFLPVYRKGARLDTVQDRRNAFERWIYAPFTMDQFFGEALKSNQGWLDITVYERPERSPESILYSTTQTGSVIQTDKVSVIELGQRKYYFTWRRGPKYIVTRDLIPSWAATIALIFTLFLVGSLVNLEILQQEVGKLAKEKTERLQALLKVTEILTGRTVNERILKEVLHTIRTDLGWPFAILWKHELPSKKWVLHEVSLHSESRYEELNKRLGALNDDETFNLLQEITTKSSGALWEKCASVLHQSPLANYCEQAGLKSILTFPIIEADRLKYLVFLLNARSPWPDDELIETVRNIGARVTQSLTQSETERALETQRQQLIRTSKMTALGEMSGGIAHEINNPLSIISAKSYQLKKMALSKDMSFEELSRSSDLLLRASERIAKIIKALRSFARLGDDDPYLPVRVNQLLMNTLELCRERFLNHGVTLTIPQNADIELECKESQVIQILLNLLNNAFDASKDATEKWVRIDVEDLGTHVKFSVTDGGSGVPESLIEKIMEPFFTTKHIGQGTGLGLSISLGLAQEHGGNLFLDRSVPNTCFVLVLPKLHTSK